jgi:hypothetical protein
VWYQWSDVHALPRATAPGLRLFRFALILAAAVVHVAPAGAQPVEPQPPRESAAAADGGAPEEPVWMEVDVPADGAEHVGPLAWLEVRGWAGVNRSGEHDVVVLVDVSGSTAYASGIDVDEDGKLGRASRRREAWRSFNPRYLSSDADDTVLAAELVATRRLVELLDPGRVRVGLISFHGRARLDALLGSRPERLAAALQRLDGSFGSGMTDMADALRLAVDDPDLVRRLPDGSGQ